MKLQTHEYKITYLTVSLPLELCKVSNFIELQSVSVNESERLKDGIEVNFDDLSRLERNIDGGVEDSLLQFASYLLKNWPHVDTFVFTV